MTITTDTEVRERKDETTLKDTKVSPPPRAWHVGGGLSVLLPGPTLQVQAFARIGRILFMDVGAVGSLQSSFAAPMVPNGGGVGLVVTF